MITSRRTFFRLAALLGTVAVLWNRLTNRSGKTRKARLLTQDGRLVEVDTDHIPGLRRKATTEEVKTWIWKNTEV
jgi:hypothetical protein